jgi:hypothetical protein
MVVSIHGAHASTHLHGLPSKLRAVQVSPTAPLSARCRSSTTGLLQNILNSRAEQGFRHWATNHDLVDDAVSADEIG